MQFTCISKLNLGKRELKNGTLQGLFLLFILFINGLHKNVEFRTAYHFADDSSMPLIKNWQN